MSFRVDKNKSDRWREFCNRNSCIIDQLPRLSQLFSSADRFDQFLQTGEHQSDDVTLTIMSLTDKEWQLFLFLVDEYSDQWETYFSPTKYISYYKEADQRDWYPSTIPFMPIDLESQHLIIHCWAKWNSTDRQMDKLLSLVIPNFRKRIVFRSLDVDQTEFHDFCRDAGVANIPALILYNEKNRFQTLIGLREPSEIAEEINTWLAGTL